MPLPLRLRDARDRVTDVSGTAISVAVRAMAVSRAAAAVLGRALRERVGTRTPLHLAASRSTNLLLLVYTTGRLRRATTPLHGFDLATMGSGKRLAVALCLPASAAPPESPWLTLHQRMHDDADHHHVAVVDMAKLRLVEPSMFFRTVILCSHEAVGELRRAVAGWAPRPVIISDRDDESFVEHVDRARQLVLARIVSDLAPSLGVRGFWRAVVSPLTTSTCDIAIVDHLTCLPNHLVLESARLRPLILPLDAAKADLARQTKGGGEPSLDRTLLNATIDAANTVLAERHRAKTLFRKLHPELPEAVSLILAAPALLPGWYGRRRGKPEEKSIEVEAAETVVQLARRQRGYGLPIPGAVVERTELFGEIGKHQRVRGAELELFSAAVGAVAVRYSAPVVRLPFGVNRAQAAIADLEANIRRGGRGTLHARKNIQAVQKLVNELHAAVASPAIDLFLRREPLAHVKIVADAPLEWLALDGLPLFLRHSTSRLPATPGHLLLDTATNYQLLNLKYRDLRRVLVLRSFDMSYGPRLALEESVRAAIARPVRGPLAAMRMATKDEGTRRRFADFSDDVELTVVDVGSEAELIAALNAFTGWIVMLDCHGGISKRTGQGELVIGSERVDPWLLRGRARVPPVVLLSACDTFMLRGSAASVASGFLFSGALTVLGTLFELDPMHAAGFAANVVNICCRLGPMVAAAAQSPARLSTLLTWAQRQTHLEDMVDAHRTSTRKPTPRLDELIDPLTLAAVTEYAWEQPVLTAISEKLQITRNEFVLATHRTHGMLGPALQYLQLGSPEAIVVEGPGQGMTETMARWRRDFGAAPWEAPRG